MIAMKGLINTLLYVINKKRLKIADKYTQHLISMFLDKFHRFLVVFKPSNYHKNYSIF